MSSLYPQWPRSLVCIVQASSAPPSHPLNEAAFGQMQVQLAADFQCRSIARLFHAFVLHEKLPLPSLTGH